MLSELFQRQPLGRRVGHHLDQGDIVDFNFTAFHYIFNIMITNASYRPLVIGQHQATNLFSKYFSGSRYKPYNNFEFQSLEILIHKHRLQDPYLSFQDPNKVLVPIIIFEQLPANNISSKYNDKIAKLSLCLRYRHSDLMDSRHSQFLIQLTIS